MEGKEKIETVFTHADKVIGISETDLGCEMRWQQGRGLVEIIDNVHRYLTKSFHMGSLSRGMDLTTLRKRVTASWPEEELIL